MDRDQGQVVPDALEVLPELGQLGVGVAVEGEADDPLLETPATPKLLKIVSKGEKFRKERLNSSIWGVVIFHLSHQPSVRFVS